MRFADYIQAEMDRRDIDKGYLARISGVSYSTIHNMMQRNSRPSYNTAVKLTRALSLPLPDMTDEGEIIEPTAVMEKARRGQKPTDKDREKADALFKERTVSRDDLENFIDEFDYNTSLEMLEVLAAKLKREQEKSEGTGGAADPREEP